MKKTPIATSDNSKTSPHPPDDVLVRVENVSKKFCRDLKRSLWYGMKDLGSELLCLRHDDDGELRKDEFWGIKDVSFELKRGECLGLIGRNGAGKTTLLRILNGLIRPDKGRIEMRGRIGALIALGAGFNPILTGRENIYINAAVLGLSKKDTDEKFEEIVEFAELGEFIDAPVQNYSSGMQVRLGFAIATALTPDILLMDEILAVGDMSFQTKCFNKIAELRKIGVASILVSHNMHHISRFCDSGLFIKSGESSTIDTVKDSISSYLSNRDKHLIVNEDKIDICRTDKIRINKAYFADEFGNIINETSSEKPIFIKIPYSIENDTLNEPVIEIVLRLNDGTPFIQFTTKNYNNCIGILAKSGEISVMIESLQANNVTLFLSVVIWEKNNSNLLFWQKGHPSLFVIGDPLSIGIISTKFNIQNTSLLC